MLMKKKTMKLAAVMAAVVLTIAVLGCALAEGTVPAVDPSPAIYVAQKTANSVVGVITSTQSWNSQTREITEEPISQGSGVVIRDGGYIVTNNHVIDGGESYQVLMADGTKIDAELIGADASTDLAVLKVSERLEDLVVAEMGSTNELVVGSTAIAVGNPGGEMLHNTVTAGIVSALERSNIKGSSTSRSIDYIQHDAAINGGNSGGGLFDYQGRLIGINTLKYTGGSYAQYTYEGLGFAIPVETMKSVTDDLIDYGKVQRAQLGIKAGDYADGPDEPMSNHAPAGVYAFDVTEGGPADKAGMKQYDCIYSVNGVHVSNFTELTTQLDKYEIGETVTVTVVRYDQIQYTTASNQDMSNYYYYFFNMPTQSMTTSGFTVSGGYDFVDLEVTLQMMEED